VNRLEELVHVFVLWGTFILSLLDWIVGESIFIIC